MRVRITLHKHVMHEAVVEREVADMLDAYKFSPADLVDESTEWKQVATATPSMSITVARDQPAVDSISAKGPK